MTDNPKEGQSFVAGPKKRRVTREEARQMGLALFDSIATQRAQNARRRLPDGGLQWTTPGGQTVTVNPPKAK